MVIDIEPICNCGCQDNHGDGLPDTFACNDPKCNYNGKLVCGACICCGDYFGPDCTCKNGSLVDPLNPLMNCRKPYTVIKSDNTTVIRYEQQICSGKGQCDECGNCECLEERKGVIPYGPYCDKVSLLRYYVREYHFIRKYYTSANMLVFRFQICDNTACERDKDGRLCGGCGICRCGKCDCEPCKLGDPNIIGDPGDTCECSLKKCRAPDDPRICSGNGVCDCDTCDCNDRYTGNFRLQTISVQLFETFA